MIAMQKIPLEDALKSVALSPNVVSRRPIFEKYDKNVQGNIYLERGQAASAVILPFNDFPELPNEKKSMGVTVGTGGNPNRAKIDPEITAEMAICEAAFQTSCVGGTWLGATDCLNFGNPEKEIQMGDFVAGVNGVKTACEKLNIPIVSGNVSLYNENNGQAVPPSALVSVFARVEAIERVKPMTWKTPGAYIYQVGAQSTALGGSEFDRIYNTQNTALPVCDYEVFTQRVNEIKALLEVGAVEAVMPLGAGGTWGTLVNMAINAEQGFSLELASQSIISDLFSETIGALVVSSQPLDKHLLLGRTTANFTAHIALETRAHTLKLEDIASEWQHQLRRVF